MFMGFDLLRLNGENLRSLPLLVRRERLQELVGCHDPSCRIHYSEHVTGAGHDLFEAADQMGREGIVSKKAHSRYRSGRSRSWLKVKCRAEEEFLVIGIEPARNGAAMALLAREAAGALEPAGAAAVTLGGKERERCWRAAEAIKKDNAAHAGFGRGSSRGAVSCVTLCALGSTTFY